MLEASAFPKTLEIVRQRVLADWQKDAEAEQRETGKTRGEHQGRVDRWWTLKRRRQELLGFSVSELWSLHRLLPSYEAAGLQLP